MTPDSGILTNLLNAFMLVFSAGTGNILGDATRFLYLLSALELTVAALFWALKGENPMVPFIQKTMAIGVFAWFVLNWATFLNWAMAGFIDIGFKAGGGGASIANFNDPSSIIDIGFNVTQPIADKINSLSTWDIGPLFVYGWSMIFILLAFFTIAIQVFITYLEFYILATLALILIPFGVTKWTSFMAEKAFGLVFSFGVKMMVLAFILSAASPVLTSIIVPADPTYNQCLSVLAGAMAIAALAWHAPGMASGLVAGGPSLTASTATRTAAGAVMGGMAAIGAGAAAGSTLASAGKGTALASTRAAASLSAAGEMGSTLAAAGGGGRGAQALGAVKGVTSMVGGKVKESLKSASMKASSPLKNAWEQGQVSAWQGMGFPATGGTNTKAPTASTPKPKSNDAVNSMMKAMHSIPPDASPSGGANPNLRT